MRNSSAVQVHELKPSYSVAEMASLLRMPAHRARRLLEKLGVLSADGGRTRVVWVSALRKAAPEVWDSIVEVHDLRAPGARPD